MITTLTVPLRVLFTWSDVMEILSYCTYFMSFLDEARHTVYIVTETRNSSLHTMDSANLPDESGLDILLLSHYYCRLIQFFRTKTGHEDGMFRNRVY